MTSKLEVRDDCSNYDKLPKLGFIIGKHILNLNPKDYVDNDGQTCELSLMQLDVPPPKGPLFVFGIPFLQKYLTAYDVQRKMVGFAVARHAGQAAGEAEALLVEASEEHGAPPAAAADALRGAAAEDALHGSVLRAVTTAEDALRGSLLRGVARH